MKKIKIVKNKKYRNRQHNLAVNDAKKTVKMATSAVRKSADDIGKAMSAISKVNSAINHIKKK